MLTYTIDSFSIWKPWGWPCELREFSMLSLLLVKICDTAEDSKKDKRCSFLFWVTWMGVELASFLDRVMALVSYFYWVQGVRWLMSHTDEIETSLWCDRMASGLGRKGMQLIIWRFVNRYTVGRILRSSSSFEILIFFSLNLNFKIAIQTDIGENGR